MNRARSFLASAAAVAVSAAGLSLVTPATPAFASTSFVLGPSAPVAGESFAATGKVSTRFKRPVVLKVYSGGAWRTAMKGYTTSSGTYRFAGMKVSAPTTYAVAAPAYRYKGKKYGASTSTKRVARPVGQSGFISVLPQVSQRGTGAFRASAALNSVLAKFSPARPGRTVTFQRFVNGSLIGSATATEGSDGTAVYKVTLAAGQTIKAIAAPRYGAPAVETTMATNGWRLAFDEEFNGSALNTGIWNYRNEGKYLPSRLKSKADRRMVSVSGGTLNLRVKPDPAHAGRFLNSQVSTENSYRFTYGTAAARIKFPTRRGQHGGFWLQSPTYSTYPGRPSVAGAEIDIAEFFGKGYTGGGLGNYLYYRNSSKKDVKSGGILPAAQKLIARGDTWWSAYHVFSVNWTPQSYTFYVDGRQLYHSTRALSHTNEFLVLSLLSSDWELKDFDKRYPPTMKVDWARVWQR
jgi:beta-glucanase (GH16 family)